MEDKLNIIREEHTGYILLKIEGRIDGYWSKHLEEYLDETVRSGNYSIALDLRGVNYMSSLGIRVLVKYKKLSRQVNSGFGILDASKSVIDLLEMAGLNTVLQWEKQVVSNRLESSSETIESDGYIYKKSTFSNRGPMECYFTGNPENIKAGGYKNSDCRSVKFGKNHFGIGLGAIGLNFDDCKNRFGEFVALGDSVVYSPAGKPRSPDFMLKSGALIPCIEILYGVIFEGGFDTVITFSPDDPDKTIGFSRLLTKLFEITGNERLVMIMLAETSGLVGVSINHSPATGEGSESNPFIFPEIKEYINFTTEPEYKQMMTITAGIASKTTEGDLEKFTRPLAPGSTVHQHFHTTIFSHHPIKKTDINLDETITAFFEQDKVHGVLHLINDSREINGIGESDFKDGVCWISSINSSMKMR